MGSLFKVFRGPTIYYLVEEHPTYSDANHRQVFIEDDVDQTFKKEFRRTSR